MLPAFPPLYPLKFHLQTTGPLRLPEYKGALFRGGFGYFFRDLVCVTRAPSCAGCPHLQTCRYSTVFESPVARDKLTVLRKYPNAPHPFVMTPPLDNRTSLPSGADMTVEVVLIGSGLEALIHFLAVFEEMGRSGRFGGPFRLAAIRSALPSGELVFDGATRRIGSSPPAWRPEVNQDETHRQFRMRLSFVTPLRMRTGGQYNQSPNFVEITQALLRRVHLLSAIYGTGGPDNPWMKPLLACADDTRTEASDFTLYPWQRSSGRQQRAIKMDGVVGMLTASGALAPLVPWFRLGEWINVGSGTSLGLGKYRLDVEA